MSVLIINYDLNTPGLNYQSLYDEIKTYQWCHILESCWLIDTSKTPKEIRDHLKKSVDKNDQVFVARLRQEWATTFSDEATEWLKDPSRSW